jgi:N-alpha-acetyl-L-2,4-diaminobutyrate deacetylase
VSDPAVSCTIDLEAPGKQVGDLSFPKVGNDGQFYTLVPIATIANGDGPTVVVSGGNHGDEYEGQIAALRLVREIQPEQVSGRIVVVPILSTEASRAGTRNWPSGANFNRSFPGRPDGTPNEQLAHFVSTVLFPLADVVIDMHSGGRSVWVLPCSHMHVVPDLEQRRAMLEGMEAWNSDFHYLYSDENGHGLLPVEAERQGKVVITTELGGGGRVPAPVHELAWSGLTNVLRHVGVLEGEVVTRASLDLPPATLVDMRGAGKNVSAPASGLCEGLLEPGAPIEEGQPIARIWSPDEPGREPVEVVSPVTGYLLSLRGTPTVGRGDFLFQVGDSITRDTLLAEVAV